MSPQIKIPPATRNVSAFQSEIFPTLDHLENFDKIVLYCPLHKAGVDPIKNIGAPALSLEQIKIINTFCFETFTFNFFL